MRPRIGYIGCDRHDRSISVNHFFAFSHPRLPIFTSQPGVERTPRLKPCTQRVPGTRAGRSSTACVKPLGACVQQVSPLGSKWSLAPSARRGQCPGAGSALPGNRLDRGGSPLVQRSCQPIRPARRSDWPDDPIGRTIRLARRADWPDEPPCQITHPAGQRPPPAVRESIEVSASTPIRAVLNPVRFAVTGEGPAATNVTSGATPSPGAGLARLPGGAGCPGWPGSHGPHGPTA